MIEISDLMNRLVKHRVRCTVSGVQDKSKRALADIKRARTLLENAELTLSWCDRYQQENPDKYPESI